jgi:hypothetical protein
MINNVNKNKIKETLKTGGFCLVFGVLIGTTVVSCNNKKSNSVQSETTIEQTTEAPRKKITKLTIEEFDKLVDEVQESNKEAGFNLRRENLELAVYINNINLATPELVEEIESFYNYNEQDMINVYLKTITAYNNDKNDYYNGKDDKYADLSLMFADDIDKETVKYIDETFNKLYCNITDGFKSEIVLSMDEFNKIVDYVMDKNEFLGIDIPKEEVETSIYERNSKYATSEVTKYINSLSLDKSISEIDEDVLNVYKRYNKNATEQFNLSDLEVESYYIEKVVSELEDYTRKNGTINGYTKDQLTVGGLFTAKLQIDDSFAYFATTGYANEYESNIKAIEEANLEAVVARTYAALGSKTSIKECETDKVKTLN